MEEYKLANGDSTYKAQSFKDEGDSYNLEVIVQETFLGNVTKGVEVTKDEVEELLKQAGSAIVHIDKETGSFLKLVQ
jgi:RNA recognition motif-containing protein